MMINKKNVFVILLLVVAIEIIFLLSHSLSSSPNKQSLEDRLLVLSSGGEDTFSALISQVRTIVNAEGMDGAIKLTELAVQKSKISIDQCHIVLHQIGHVAYAKYPNDLTALARHDSYLCIASFQHGIEAQIAIDHSDSPEYLKKYCQILRNVLPGIWCYHGAGHAFFQITRNVNKALDKCDLLQGGVETNLENCYRGIFSEYGNEALGYDGDTGKSIPGGPLVKLDMENPYGFCKSFDQKYRPACYSQLTKVYIGGDIEASLQKCFKDPDMEVQKICVNIVSGVYSRSILATTGFMNAPKILSSMPQSLRQEYIKGVKETFVGYGDSGIEKDWQATCNSLKEEIDRQFCNKLK